MLKKYSIKKKTKEIEIKDAEKKQMKKLKILDKERKQKATEIKDAQKAKNNCFKRSTKN